VSACASVNELHCSRGPECRGTAKELECREQITEYTLQHFVRLRHAGSISERQCRHLSDSIQQWGRGVGSVVVDENVPLSVQVQQGVCDTIHTRLC
jgi:hypothetical protein